MPNVDTWTAGDIVQLDNPQVLIPLGGSRIQIDRIFEHFGMRWSVPLPNNPLLLLPPGMYIVRAGGRVLCLSREGVANVQV